MKTVQSSTVNNVADHTPNTNARQLRGLIWMCGILLMLVATAAIYFIWLMTQNTDFIKIDLRIIDRSEWLGEPPNGTKQLVTPISNVIIHHTASEGCDTEVICIYRMRLIQNFHMNSMGFTDIAYNFLVGGDGQVYVGRGWHIQGQHVRGYGAVSMSIAFIGTFVNVAPSEHQVNAAKRLLEEGVRLHKLHPDYHIYAHRQLSATESPGQKLYELMQQWPRWSENVATLRRLNNEPLRLVTRAAWLAQPSQKMLLPMSLPVRNVRFESTMTEACNSQAMCTFRVRYLQTLHMEGRNHKDINYNFVVGGDNSVYVGRGWDYSCEPPSTDESQFDGIIVGFIGALKPTTSQMNVARELLTKGIKLGKLNSNYNLMDELSKL